MELLEDDPEEVAESAARRALTMLDAVDAPSGRLPVVVGNGFGGVLLHEAVGHGLEADAVQKRASVYAGKLGEQLAEGFVTAYDDGRREGEWGSDGIDDEGTPTRRTTVIEDGELTSYLYDLLRARKDGVESTGNGRRESFRHLPVPRMTNTYFAPGDATPEDLIGGVERGLYAVSFGGGQVEPATGDFVFGVSEGYLIEDGKVTLAGARRDAGRQRPRGARGHRRHRRRPGHRHRLLRQGRPERARRRGPAARAHPRAHGRRDGLSVSDELADAARRAVEAALAAGAERRRGLGRAQRQPPGAGLRGRGGEPQRRRRPRRRPARVRRRALGLRLRHRPGRRGRRRAGHGRGARRPRWPTPTSTAACPRSAATSEVDGLDSPELADWTTERKVELALEVERAARAREGVTQVENAVYADAEADVALANSRGFAAGYSVTDAWAYASAFAGEGADLMTGLGVGLGRDPEASTPRPSAARRPSARWRSRARASPRAGAARWCSTRSWRPRSSASSARCCRPTRCSAGARCSRAARATRWPTPRCALADDATDPEGPASAPFDGEGVAHAPHAADRGRPARRPSCSTRAPRARPAAPPPATPAAAPTARRRRWAPRTWCSRRATRTSSELVAEAGEGLYVTDVAGLHSGVNPVSGTFSVGASGRLIEGGELGPPGARADDRQRPRDDAQGGAGGGLRGPLGALRRQREGAAAADRRDVGLRLVSAKPARFFGVFRFPSGFSVVACPRALLRSGATRTSEEEQA